MVEMLLITKILVREHSQEVVLHTEESLDMVTIWEEDVSTHILVTISFTKSEKLI